MFPHLFLYVLDQLFHVPVRKAEHVKVLWNGARHGGEGVLGAFFLAAYAAVQRQRHSMCDTDTAACLHQCSDHAPFWGPREE